jgi:hypothetical protein
MLSKLIESTYIENKESFAAFKKRSHDRHVLNAGRELPGQTHSTTGILVHKLY